jgi:predicted Rossmann-fold nucleotide-binding protein
VINIRSSDIVVILQGSIGTLNEFTIAYDEGKIIGILEGTGGVADHARELVAVLAKKTQAALFFERDAVELLRLCLAERVRRRG